MPCPFLSPMLQLVLPGLTRAPGAGPINPGATAKQIEAPAPPLFSFPFSRASFSSPFGPGLSHRDDAREIHATSALFGTGIDKMREKVQKGKLPFKKQYFFPASKVSLQCACANESYSCRFISLVHGGDVAVEGKETDDAASTNDAAPPPPITEKGRRQLKGE